MKQILNDINEMAKNAGLPEVGTKAFNDLCAEYFGGKPPETNNEGEAPFTGTRGEGFTGGNWEAEKYEDGSFYILTAKNHKISETKWAIAHCMAGTHGNSEDEAEANARLIAESKSMYYALKEILPEYERMLPSSIGLKHPAKLAAENAKAIIERINQK